MIILFDIGATKMRVASSDGKRITKTIIHPTPQKYEEAVTLFERTAMELAGGKKIQKAYGGVASSLDKKKEILWNVPNLPLWRGKNLLRDLRKSLKTKQVTLENDTALVGLGEAVLGAGRGKNIVAYITVSTGINGVRIVNRSIDYNAIGFEVGHQIIGALHSETLEYFVGAASIAHRCGVARAEEVTDKGVWRAAEGKLAIGLYNTILHWSPDVVVLGGGSIVHKLIDPRRVSDAIGKLPLALSQFPIIRASKLGDLGGLYGALLALSRKK